MRLAGLLLACTAIAAAQAPTCDVAPGWAQKGASRTFVAENLYDYMDGNSEGYLIYGFNRMQGVTCVSGERQLVMDISEMADEDAAYGIFTANRDTNAPATPLGMGGQIVPRRAMFAKGKYYVEIAANPEGDYTAVLTAAAQALEKRIAGRTEPPSALSWFPAGNLVSVRLVPESVLGMRVLKRGYIAEYQQGKAFVVLEESADSAKAVMEKVRARLGTTQPCELGDEAFQAQDQYLKGVCVFRKGRYVGGYANAATSEQAKVLARQVAERIHGSE